MTVPTGTLQTFTQVNIREDLANVIFNVAPYETPTLNIAKRTKATQSLHEWNTDTLDAQDLTNAMVEGDNPTNKTVTVTTRLGNYVQTSYKAIQISGRSQAVIAAGGSNKMGYQLLKKSKELKRDMNGIITNNTARAVGTSTTATKTAGLPCWLATNTVFNSGGTPAGANPSVTDGTATRTDSGTTVAITEDNVAQMLQDCFTNSGSVPPYLMVSAANKRNISKFTGPGTRFEKVQDKTLSVALDVYDSDFGEIKIVPDIFLARTKDCFGINPQYFRVAFLRTFETIPLAKTGDSDQKMILVDYALEVGNEKALGGIFDTTG